MTQPVESPDELLCFALYSADHAMGRLYRGLLAPMGLTYPQFLVLLALGGDAPLSLRDLGQAVALESNTLTPLLKRMQQAGLLTRSRNPEDERALQVALTDQGRALRARVQQMQSQILRDSGIDPARLRRLRDDIRDLRAQLERAAG